MHSPSTGTLALIGDRHARERPRVARLDLVGRGQRALGVDLDERVQLAVERLDPVQARLHELARGQLAAADAGRQVARRREHEIAGGHEPGAGAYATEPD